MDHPFDEKKLEYLTALAEVKKPIIYGVGPAASLMHALLRARGREVFCFVGDANRGGEFEGCPRRSVYDLLLEELEDKFVILTTKSPTTLAVDWSQARNNLKSLGLLSKKDFFDPYPVSQLTCLDANLGHNQPGGEHWPGFKTCLGSGSPEARTIVTLGASTTDSFLSRYSAYFLSWPEFLGRRLAAAGARVNLFNGAVIDYTSSQELIKLIRDVIPQAPDTVISFSGISDFNKYIPPEKEAVYGANADFKSMLNRCRRPFLSRSTELFYSTGQQHFLEHAHWRDKGDLGGEISFGLRNDKTGARFWVDNMRMMHALGREFGFTFIGILQPSVYTLQNSKFQALNQKHINTRWGCQLERKMRRCYDQARELIAEYQYILDYTSIFDAVDDYVYCDYAHVIPEANQIIAARIHEDLRRLEVI